ncbi:hypothetical protein [Bacillus wiedmannii]|uniref:hypothetical protein n=1 Tax=Bacillus wiedmannii TaxID=1890302 RepID=UPI000BEE248E|nr:hypothetical protein [Bacillus wiedmannii]PEA75097.1 hypothetical protein CON92_26390 [Bacillus wiedmannii]
MVISNLKNSLDLVKVRQTQELEELRETHRQERADLISNCTHCYDNGVSAVITKGVQWDYYYECSICERRVEKKTSFK